LLDLHGKTMTVKREYVSAFSGYQSRVRELERMVQSERDRMQREDLLKFQVQEIDKVNLIADEEDALKAERNRLRHSEKLHQTIERAQDLIAEADGSVLELLGKVNNELNPLAKIDPALEKQVARGQTAYYEIQELAGELRDYVRAIEFSPKRLEEIEDRLAEINGLKRKYGADISAILACREKIAEELDAITSYQERLDSLKDDVRQCEIQAGKLATQLAEKRESAAVELKKKVEKELRDLNMKNVQFGVRFDYGQTEVGNSGGQSLEHPAAETGGFVVYKGLKARMTPTGLGAIEFLFSPNPGEDLRPLAKIISGGELSRVMLALKSILNEQDTIPGWQTRITRSGRAFRGKGPARKLPSWITTSASRKSLACPAEKKSPRPRSSSPGK
jgi:DNA repair protein RecN (Recombination protein N)